MSQRDPLGKYFAESIGVHVVLATVIVLSGLWKFSKESWGSEHVSTGSVGVTMVSSIPIPRKEAPENPLANDSTSDVPQAPAPVKQQQQVKAPDPKAIEIPDKLKHKISPKQQSLTPYRPPAAEYQANQVYSQAPQAVSSKAYGIQGSSGIDIGPSSVFGTRFGDYANTIRDRIASKWNTAGVHAGAGQWAAITFTIARSGTVGDVKVSHASGSFDLDTSSQRAVLDATPLPPLPAGFDKDEATVEFRFQLKQ